MESPRVAKRGTKNKPFAVFQPLGKEAELNGKLQISN
jgi:hypothetical protein